MNEDEQSRLLQRAQSWFSSGHQVDAYVERARAGLSQFERVAMDWLPAPPATILDLGTGAGRVAIHLARHGYNVTGTDFSALLVTAATEYARTEAVSAQFLLIQPDTVPDDLGPYDAVINIRQYCYLPGRALRQRYLEAIKGLLRPDGLFVLINHVVPNTRAAIETIAADPHHGSAAAAFTSLEPLDTFSNGEGYVHWFTVEGLLEELSTSALSVEDSLDSDDGLQVALALRMNR